MGFVWLASYPRSGSNFFRHVIEQVYGVRTWTQYSHDFYDDLFNDRMSSRLTRQKIDDLGLSHYFIKSHGWDREPATSDKALLLVRDGRDAICSHAQFECDYGYCADLDISRTEAMERLITGDVPLLNNPRVVWSWSEHVASWRARKAHTVMVRFESLINDPVGTVISAVEALKIGIQPPKSYADIHTFETLKEQCPALFRKGKVGAWKEDMPARLQDMFWERHGREMLSIGYGSGDE